jgi:hypothetical protein
MEKDYRAVNASTGNFSTTIQNGGLGGLWLPLRDHRYWVFSAFDGFWFGLLGLAELQCHQIR